jgi:hypothetical protein
MRSLSYAFVGRTTFVLGYLLAVAFVGTPGWAAALAGLSLVALWVAPVVLGKDGRRPHPSTGTEQSRFPLRVMPPLGRPGCRQRPRTGWRALGSARVSPGPAG